MRLAVLIPVFNERDLAPVMLERLLAAPTPAIPPVEPPATAAGPAAARALPGESIERTIYLVDDGSTDGTRAWLESLAQRDDLHARVRVLLHPTNRGKGAAVRTALAAALDERADLLLIHDADLEYDPADHAKVLAPLLDGRADAVIGTRFLGETHRVLYYWHSKANRFITGLSNIFTNLNLTDIECCLKAFTRDVALQLRLREDRFGIEPELVARIARARVPDGAGRTRRARVYEVAVSYAGRTYAEGKKINWRDGFSALRCILRYNLLG
ncbi:MAG: glycosyltransferase family 2 protein [Phycisphaeraceae bacterium]|nr:glycosyltransferase family 2 protein [Phycisphaeraceae bacterium]